MELLVAGELLAGGLLVGCNPGLLVVSCPMPLLALGEVSGLDIGPLDGSEIGEDADDAANLVDLRKFILHHSYNFCQVLWFIRI